VYAYNQKNAKKRNLIMRDAAKHVYVKETQVSTDDCISKQTKIDLDEKKLSCDDHQYSDKPKEKAIRK